MELQKNPSHSDSHPRGSVKLVSLEKENSCMPPDLAYKRAKAWCLRLGMSSSAWTGYAKMHANPLTATSYAVVSDTVMGCRCDIHPDRTAVQPVMGLLCSYHSTPDLHHRNVWHSSCVLAVGPRASLPQAVPCNPSLPHTLLLATTVRWLSAASDNNAMEQQGQVGVGKLVGTIVHFPFCVGWKGQRGASCETQKEHFTSHV